MPADLYEALSGDQRWRYPFRTGVGAGPPMDVTGNLARLAGAGGRLALNAARTVAGDPQATQRFQSPFQQPPRPEQPPMQAPPGRGLQAMSQAQTSMTPASAPLPPVPREPSAASPMAQMAVAPQVAGTTADTPAPLSANRASSPGYGGGAGVVPPQRGATPNQYSQGALDSYRRFLESRLKDPWAGGGTFMLGDPNQPYRDLEMRNQVAQSLLALNEADPEKQLAMFDKLGQNPRRLGIYLAGRGQDPNIARAIPQSTEAGGPGYNIGNLEQAATDPELAYLHQAMGPDSGLNFGQKLDLASKFMETGNPKYRDYTRAWLQRQQATNAAWERDVQSVQPRTPNQINLRGPLEILGGLTGRDRTMELARNERARQILQMFQQPSAPPAMAGTLGGY